MMIDEVAASVVLLQTSILPSISFLKHCCLGDWILLLAPAVAAAAT
jgi:hypothetical protein